MEHRIVYDASNYSDDLASLKDSIRRTNVFDYELAYTVAREKVFESELIDDIKGNGYVIEKKVWYLENDKTQVIIKILKDSEVHAEYEYFDSKQNREIEEPCVLIVYFKDSVDGTNISKIIAGHCVKEARSEVCIRKMSIASNGSLSVSAPSFMNLNNTDEYKSCYYPYLNTDELFKQYTLADEAIIVLSGDPGLGKTKLVNMYLRYLMENGNILLDDDDLGMVDAVYVKNEDVLISDEFWNYLRESKPNVVILDDIDTYLTARTKSVRSEQEFRHNKFISNFLSFSDGLFSEEKRIKFLLTTNMESSTIDKALLRKGRMFNILKLRALHYEEAKSIWEREGLGESFEDNFKEGAITPAELGSLIKSLKSAKENDTIYEPYILEEGISVLETSIKMSTSKKTGL